jgi:hypothetical protein
MVNVATEKTPFDFEIVKVEVTADRFPFTVDLKRVISEINIFEHMDKPYLTGDITFMDNANLYNQINWLGTEKIEIVIRTEPKADFTISRKFRVVRIEQAVKTNDTNEVFLLSIIEEHAYESTLKRVQQSYQGYHRDIIQAILKDHLELELMFDERKRVEGFSKIRAIVPNMTPLDAANWIKDGAPDAFGSPYFLYASLADERIRYVDLETILGLAPMNEGKPYMFNQAFGPKLAEMNELDQAFIIQTYRTAKTEDLFRLFKSGYVSGNWNFFDIYRGDQYRVKHDIKDTFDKMVSRKVFHPSQNDPVYDEEAGIETYSTREVNNIATSRLYNDWELFKGYHEDEEESLHEAKVIQKSLRHFLLKSPIDINVPGKNFLLKNKNMTLANIIRLDFQINDDLAENQFKRDDKRSGDYLIYAARHVFTANRYTVNLTCAKMAQRNGVET